MKVVPLQSGSAGNCIYVETKHKRLLFDAGISGKAAEERLLKVGCRIDDIDALFITHEHSDHMRNAKLFGKKYGIPIHITAKTYNKAKSRFGLDDSIETNLFKSGQDVVLGSTTIQSIPTTHDAIDGSLFVVHEDGLSVGIFTDIGSVTEALKEVLPKLDGVFIESNYDPQMLRDGPYPSFLKKRIAGRGGHISNKDCARVLASFTGPRLQWACLAHLSEENNTPELALAECAKKLGPDFPVAVASRTDIGPVFKTTKDLFNCSAIATTACKIGVEEMSQHSLLFSSAD